MPSLYEQNSNLEAALRDSDDSISSPNYTKPVYVPGAFKIVVNDIVEWISVLKPNILAIAGMGNSSVPVLGAVSFVTGLPMIVVRKHSETEHQRHAGKVVTGYAGDGKYLIIDDLIDTGKTIIRIVERVSVVNPFLKPLAVLLYRDFRLREPTLKFETCGQEFNLPVYQLY